MMDVERYWSDSMTRALCARDLARKCNIVNRERLFVLGLLSDIGHMVMYMRIPDIAAKLVTLRRTSVEPMHLIERRNLACDYAQVGGALLRRWSLPPGLYLPIEQQTEPAPEQQHAIESALLHVVEGVLRAHVEGFDPLRLTLPAAWSILDLDTETVLASIGEAATSAREMAGIFAMKRAA
jgi:HD-like signal output (HDOD) protein